MQEHPREGRTNAAACLSRHTPHSAEKRVVVTVDNDAGANVLTWNRTCQLPPVPLRQACLPTDARPCQATDGLDGPALGATTESVAAKADRLGKELSDPSPYGILTGIGTR
jgi:hypothetical protein